MKRKVFFMVSLICTMHLLAAYDFKSGDLCYNYGAMGEVMVTCQSLYSDNYRGLTDVVIPAYVTHGGSTYYVTEIGICAFSNCATLKNVIISSGVREIGQMAFSECYNLTSITIPSSVKVMDWMAFNNCTSLKAVNIPNSVTVIADDLFSGCTSLTSVTIPNSVDTVGWYSFQGCSKLTSLIIGARVKDIGVDAFKGCTSLASVTNYAIVPQYIDSYTFADKTKGCVLYVPQKSLNAYKTDEGWRDFSKILPISADNTSSASNTVNIIPSVSTANITWPQISGATSYEFVIKDMDGNVICTLVFNAQGQLLSIAFVPGRDNATEQTQAAGFSFTVTGLEVGTTYSYTLTAKDSSGKALDTKQGSFTTKSPTGIVDVISDGDSSNGRKFFHNGQLYILRDGKTYTATGQEVR